MATASPIRLLLVNANPAISQALGVHLGGPGLRYRLRDAGSREGFFDGLHRHHPDLILVGEDGIPDLALKEVLEMTRELDPGLPVVVLGDRRRERSSMDVLRKDGSEYVRLAEVERLPSVIERSLRERQSRIGRLQNEIQRAARLMQENQRLVTIGRLAGSIAHEINNPLESVTNLLFLMEHEPGIPTAVRDYLTTAQGELARIVQISKQTLNFYREAPAPVPVRLSNLLEEVLVLYTRRIFEKHIELVRQFYSEEPIVIFPGEMRQVFSNLISNAIEATSGNGKLYLRIRKSRLWQDSGVVGLRVTIADNGAGMVAEVRRHVGEPFFTTKGQCGTGLGLWVTQSIIKRYGGNLLLHSSTGKHHGTVFSVFLPTNLRPHAVPSPTGPTADQHNSAAEVEGPHGKPLGPQRRMGHS